MWNSCYFGVGIAQSLQVPAYGLDGPGFDSQREQEGFLFYNILTGSVANAAFCSMVNAVHYLE